MFKIGRNMKEYESLQGGTYVLKVLKWIKVKFLFPNIVSGLILRWMCEINTLDF